jgi:hypothetical protein
MYSNWALGFQLPNRFAVFTQAFPFFKDVNAVEWSLAQTMRDL